MKTRTPAFPSLGAEAALAQVEVRQTLAMGLVPLGIVIFLVAASLPEWPSRGLWIGAGLILAGMVLLSALWRLSGHRHLRGFSTTHFLIRYLFIVLCPILLWIVFDEVILELAGSGPPILLALLLLIYPFGRILRERVGPDPMKEPRLEMARITCQQLQMVLFVFALMGLLSGAIRDANKDYPTDPTVLLLLLWLLALMAALAGAVLWGAHWIRLFGKPSPPQTLDDESPPAPPGGSPRFGSDQF